MGAEIQLTTATISRNACDQPLRLDSHGQTEYSPAMSATLTSTPVIDALMAAISCLSREEKEVLVERVQGEISDEDEIPQWHRDILEEREELHRKGLDQPMPLEEGLRQVRERLHARGIMAE